MDVLLGKEYVVAAAAYDEASILASTARQRSIDRVEPLPCPVAETSGLAIFQSSHLP